MVTLVSLTRVAKLQPAPADYILRDVRERCPRKRINQSVLIPRVSRRDSLLLADFYLPRSRARARSLTDILHDRGRLDFSPLGDRNCVKVV